MLQSRNNSHNYFIMLKNVIHFEWAVCKFAFHIQNFYPIHANRFWPKKSLFYRLRTNKMELPTLETIVWCANAKYDHLEEKIRKEKKSNGDCLCISPNSLIWLVKFGRFLIGSSVSTFYPTSISLTFNEIQIDIKHTCQFYGHLFNLINFKQTLCFTTRTMCSIRFLFISFYWCFEITGRVTIRLFFNLAHLNQTKS